MNNIMYYVGYSNKASRVLLVLLMVYSRMQLVSAAILDTESQQFFGQELRVCSSLNNRNPDRNAR
jgi:hypothetical protein